MKKCIFMILGITLNLVSPIDAYISERDIAYTSSIMRKMGANFADAFVLWRTDLFRMMRTRGNIKFTLHEAGKSLVDATNEGNDPVTKLLVALFPSNNGTLEIAAGGTNNFARAMGSLSVKVQAQIIAKLLKACKTINDSEDKTLDINQLSNNIYAQIIQLIDWPAIINSNCKLSHIRETVKKIVSLVCASSAFEKKLEIYTKHITESMILGFCCFEFDGLVGVRTLLNAFVEEKLIDSLDDDLLDVTEEKYIENIKKLVDDYSKTDNIDPLLMECKASDLFEPWMSYEKFCDIFKEVKDDLKDLQKKLEDLQKDGTKKKERKEINKNLSELVTSLVDTKVPGLNASLHDELIAFLKKFDWNKGSDFTKDITWENKGFNRYFGDKISEQEFIDFCRDNKKNPDKILLKITELIGKQPQLPVSQLLARFYSGYNERLDRHMTIVKEKVKKYIEQREELTYCYDFRPRLFRLVNRIEKISTEDLLILNAGKTGSITPYPTSGDFEQNLNVSINGMKFADCVETTIRHLVSMMCKYDNKKNRISVPENFNELTKKFFKENENKVSMFNTRSTELHTAWVEMLYKIPAYVGVQRTGDGALISDIENIKNVLAFLTTRNREEYEEQRKKELIDILNHGRDDAKFILADSSEKSQGETVLKLQKRDEEFAFVLSVCSWHSCLEGGDQAGSSVLAYEISDKSNDTARLYAASLSFPDEIGLCFEYDILKKIERPLMRDFLHGSSPSINDVTKHTLLKMMDTENANYADWIKSRIEASIGLDNVLVAQAAVNKAASDKNIAFTITQVTDKIKKNPLSVSSSRIIAEEIINSVLGGLQVDKATIANIFFDACSKTINIEDTTKREEKVNRFKDDFNANIEYINERTLKVFQKIIGYQYKLNQETRGVESAIFTEENLKNCGINVNDTGTIITACNVIKAIVLEFNSCTQLDLGISSFPGIAVALDQLRQNFSDVYKYVRSDVVNVKDTIKGYLIKIANCSGDAKYKWFRSLENFLETLNPSKKSVIDALETGYCYFEVDIADFFIGLNIIKRSDNALFKKLNEAVKLRIDGKTVSGTDDCCLKQILIAYLHNLAGKTPNLIDRLRSELAEVINEWKMEKITIDLFYERKAEVTPDNMQILASLKLVEQDSDLFEKLNDIILFWENSRIVSTKSALDNHFSKVISTFKSEEEHSILENLKSIAKVDI